MNFPETVYTIDVLMLVLIALMAVDGLRRGFSSEMAVTMVLSFGILSFFLFYPTLTQMTARTWSAIPAMAVQVLVAVVMGLFLFLVYFPVRFWVHRSVAKREKPERLERLGGFSFGACRGVLAAFLILTALSLIPSHALYDMISRRSVLGAWVCEHVTPGLHARFMEMPVFGEGEE